MDNLEPKNYTPLPSNLLPSKKELIEEFAKSKGRIPKAIVAEVKVVRQAARDLQDLKDAPIKAAKAKERAIEVEANRLVRIKKNRVIKEQRLDLFLAEFVKNGGNGTKAMQTIAPHLSPHVANVTASLYMKELRTLGRYYLEKKGHSYGKLLDIAMDKIKDSKTPEWWDRIMKIADYEDFLTKEKKGGPQIVNIIQSHKDLTSSYIEGEVEDEKPIPEDENRL